MANQKFKKGDIVTWTSQSQGYTRTKTGKIVAVVQAGQEPLTKVPEGCSLGKPGWVRDHESYLVQVDGKKRLYWPLVSKLSLAQ